MNTSTIDTAIEQAYNAALNNPNLFNYEETKNLFFQPPTPLEGDANKTVEVHVYRHVSGQKGFRVVGRIKSGLCVVTRIKNYGPDTESEKPWPSDIDAAIDEFNKQRLQIAQQYINQYFDAFTLVELSKKLAAGSFQQYPKIAATLEWMDQVKLLVLNQQNPTFPAPPYSAAEVLAE